jgi:hypothetical protein
MPADVCDMESLRKAIVAIQWRFGNVMHIVHTAAVIEDAVVHNVTFSLLERVLKPKVMGSWNLHLLSEQLCPQLKSFVCLGSAACVPTLIKHTLPSHMICAVSHWVLKVKSPTLLVISS